MQAMATTQAMLSANLTVAPVAVSSCENSTRSSASSKLSSLSVAGSSIHGSVAGLGAGKRTVGVQKQSTVAVRAAVAAGAETAAPKSQQQKSQYDITTLTTWLLKKEQAGVIDGELTIVLSSIALACKQIASLVQRAGISNLTGLQGAANIQGEDQKKLDVISNEVRLPQLFKILRNRVDSETFSLLLHPHSETWCGRDSVPVSACL